MATADFDTRSVLTMDTTPTFGGGGSAYSLAEFAASALTLSAGVRPHGVLVFSADSNFRATVFAGGVPAYRFASNSTGTKTELVRICYGGAEEPIVMYDRKLLGAVLVRPDGAKLKVSRYLRPLKTKPAGARHGASFDFEGTTYEWRIDLLGKMACFEEGASPSDPVAWHNRHRKLVVDGKPVMRPAAMGLSERAANPPLRDQIILSWMIVTETARTWPYNVQ